MKLIPKYKHAGTLNKEWIKDRDINGNWGYRNIKTGQFRTTLPNSQEEKRQEQTKRNNAVLKTYSANKSKFDESYESRRRNHSDETVKKVISKPVITVDSDGNANTGYSRQLAPGEDSAQLNTFIEEQIPIARGIRLVTGLGKLALSKLGSNEVSHWARNSLVNEAAGDIASTVRAADTKAIAENFINDWTQVRPNVEYRPLKGGPVKIEKDIVRGVDGSARIVTTRTPVKLPEGQVDVQGQGRIPVWIEEGQPPRVINGLNTRSNYDFNYAETQGYNLPNSDIRIGLDHITYPEDKLVHYSSDLMPIRNNQFQPKPAQDLPDSFSAIWWERNHPASSYGNSKLTFTKVPHTEGYEVANPTVFGDNQTITTGAYPITGAETMRPNPFTGFWDHIRYQEQPQGIASFSSFKPTKKAWTTGSVEGNEATSYFFRKSPDQQFELVKDQEPGNYSIHFKTDRGALSYGDKMQLFAKVADEIPEGGLISTWGTISKGGVHGIDRFGSDFGFQRAGNRQLTLKDTGEPVSVGIYRKPNPRGYYSVGTPGYPYLYDPVTKQWDTSTISQLLKSGKQEFIDWMNNPSYRKAAEANQVEAESMGLAYTPTYEKTEYLHPQSTTVKNIGNSSLGGTTDRNGDIVINVQTAQNPKDVMAHEFGHANYHGNVSESTMANTEQGKKEWQYLKFKAGQVFKPDSWYSDKFDLNSHAPEAVMNARDYGKEIGLKIGQEYPGYEKALELINSNNGFKSGLRSMFYLDKEHMPYVWKALTGTQFAVPAVGFSLPFLNNNN